MLGFRNLILLLSGFHYIASIDITENTFTTNQGATQWGASSVAAGVFWAITQDGNVDFNGNLILQGDLFIRGTPELLGFTITVSDLLATTLVNGKWIIDSRGTNYYPYYRVVSQTFQNNGQIYWIGSDWYGAPYMEIGSANWDNTGSIKFEDDDYTSGVVHLGLLAGSITNDGSICIVRMDYTQENTIAGDGCFDIGNDGVVVFGDGFDNAGQNIYFSDDGGSLTVTLDSVNRDLLVFGFGGTNTIGLNQAIDSFDYDTDSGILTLVSSGTSFNFDIGVGYDEALFTQVSSRLPTGQTVDNGGIQY